MTLTAKIVPSSPYFLPLTQTFFWLVTQSLLPNERLLKRAVKFRSFCSQRSARDHVQITGEPIDAKSLFTKKSTINCVRTGFLVEINFPAS